MKLNLFSLLASAMIRGSLVSRLVGAIQVSGGGLEPSARWHRLLQIQNRRGRLGTRLGESKKLFHVSVEKLFSRTLRTEITLLHPNDFFLTALIGWLGHKGNSFLIV